jgi:hypothetical protein
MLDEEVRAPRLKYPVRFSDNLSRIVDSDLVLGSFMELV